MPNRGGAVKLLGDSRSLSPLAMIGAAGFLAVACVGWWVGRNYTRLSTENRVAVQAFEQQRNLERTRAEQERERAAAEAMRGTKCGERLAQLEDEELELYELCRMACDTAPNSGAGALAADLSAIHRSYQELRTSCSKVSSLPETLNGRTATDAKYQACLFMQHSTCLTDTGR
jgi:hypothetical protein